MSYPDFVYKIFYGKKGSKKYVFGFILPNKAVEIEEDTLKKNQASIKDIEMKSGVNFPKMLKDETNLDLCKYFDCKLNKIVSWDYSSKTDKRKNLCK